MDPPLAFGGCDLVIIDYPLTEAFLVTLLLNRSWNFGKYNHNTVLLLEKVTFFFGYLSYLHIINDFSFQTEGVVETREAVL